MYYLAGDIGGTKAILQLIHQTDDTSEFEVIAQKRFECQAFRSLPQIIQHFLQESGLRDQSVQVATFGLPGPVNGRVVELTNLPWIVDADQLEQDCSIGRVYFINDFYAAALGVDVVDEGSLTSLYQPASQSSPLANRLVIGAGTGLGVAPVYFDGARYLPLSSEGGHFDFAPISETQQLILNWLWQRWDHVSYERLLSGGGLEALYRFFQLHDVPCSFSYSSSQNLNKNSVFKQQNMSLGSVVAAADVETSSGSGLAPTIHAMAIAGDDVAQKALQEFVTIYGAFVGAVALIWNAPGGIYLAGGIAAKVIDFMQQPFFNMAYLEKGRMSKLVADMPVFIVTDETVGLKGAMLHNLQSLAVD